MYVCEMYGMFFKIFSVASTLFAPLGRFDLTMPIDRITE